MQASGRQRHATVVLLHGFPGYEGALDVGQAMRRAGFNVLAIHYRGSWGSEGRFSFANCIEDADAAVAFLRSTKTAAQFRIDRTRIYAVGQSMGGFLAVMAAARSRHVKGVVYISGWDLGNTARSWQGKPRKEIVDDFSATALKLRGTTGRRLVREALAHAADWQMAAMAPRIAARPILMTVAKDEEFDHPPTINFEPLRRALMQAGARDVQVAWFATDHAYSDERLKLSATIVAWLNRVAYRSRG